MKLHSYDSAAEVLGCSRSQVQKMCLRGELPIIKVGNRTRIDELDLQAWAKANKHKNCSEDNRKHPLPTTETTHARS